MMEDPPKLVKKKTLRDKDRYVQSTHDVSKFKELDDSNNLPSFDGTGNFQGAFNMVDHSVYDLSLQPPEDRMIYLDHNAPHH